MSLEDKNKETVIVVFGGQNAEHEISCRSVQFLLENLPKQRFDIVCVGLSKKNEWLLLDCEKLVKVSGAIDIEKSFLNRNQKEPIQANIDNHERSLASLFDLLLERKVIKNAGTDRITLFPMIHGSFGENGSLQGFCELLDIAYVGCDLATCAITSDKILAKKLSQADNISVVPYRVVNNSLWQADREQQIERLCQFSPLPLFVKPVNMGSSIGAGLAKDRVQLAQRIDEALAYGDRVLVEKFIDARELEMAYFGDNKTVHQIYGPGEIEVLSDFYSYEAKYLELDQAKVVVPANNLSDSIKAELRDASYQLVETFGIYGMCRLDFFVDKKTNQVYFNEAQPIPGFVEISQYPKLVMSEGRKAADFLEKLVDFAQIRRQNTVKSPLEKGTTN